MKKLNTYMIIVIDKKDNLEKEFRLIDAVNAEDVLTIFKTNYAAEFYNYRIKIRPQGAFNV